MKSTLILLTAILLAPLAALHAADASAPVAPAASPHVTDWLKDARLGVFMHFWPNGDRDMKLVDAFDVPAVTWQFEADSPGRPADVRRNRSDGHGLSRLGRDRG